MDYNNYEISFKLNKKRTDKALGVGVGLDAGLGLGDEGKHCRIELSI